MPVPMVLCHDRGDLVPQPGFKKFFFGAIIFDLENESPANYIRIPLQVLF